MAPPNHEAADEDEDLARAIALSIETHRHRRQESQLPPVERARPHHVDTPQALGQRKIAARSISGKPIKTVRWLDLQQPKNAPMVTPASSLHDRSALDEQRALDWRQRVLQSCKNRRTHFRDRDFPACSRSLFGDAGNAHPRATSGYGGGATVAHWQRPAQIPGLGGGRGDDWVIFRSTPGPEDIAQGGIADCWIMSALAVLAQRPELLRRIVVTPDVNRAGIYQVRICKAGTWSVVTVDDRLPCGAHGQLAFGQARRRQLWVPLIEKALAKTFGSYVALESGTCAEGMALLTGFPTESINLGKARQGNEKAVGGVVPGTNDDDDDDDDDANGVSPPPPPPRMPPPRHAPGRGQAMAKHGRGIPGKRDGRGNNVPMPMPMLWGRLLSFKEAGFLMGASCGARVGNGAPPAEAYSRMGLQRSHAYSVLSVHQVGTVRLLRLRNPWGRKGGWRGAYGKGSRAWTPALRRAVGWGTQRAQDAASRGVFWMSLEDFALFFSTLDVCKVRPADTWVQVRSSAPLRDATAVPTSMQPPPAAGAAATPGPSPAALPYFAVQAFDGTSVDLGVYTASGRRAAASRWMVPQNKAHLEARPSVGVVVLRLPTSLPVDALGTSPVSRILAPELAAGPGSLCPTSRRSRDVVLGGSSRSLDSRTGSEEHQLDAGTYVILPIIFNSAQAASVRRRPKNKATRTGRKRLAEPEGRFVLTVHASRPLLVTPLSTTAPELARALLLQARRFGKRDEPYPGMCLYQLSDAVGTIIVAENTRGWPRGRGTTTGRRQKQKRGHCQRFCVTVQFRVAGGATSPMVSSRGGWHLVDRLPPRTAQVLLVSTQLMYGVGFQYSCSYRFTVDKSSSGGSSSHKPAVMSGSLHAPFCIDDDGQHGVGPPAGGGGQHVQIRSKETWK